MEQRALFPNKFLPYLLVAPQVAVTIGLFIWPAAQAVYQSVFLSDPFGLSIKFVGLQNFTDLLIDPLYLGSAWVTLVFSGAVALVALSAALLLSVTADRALRGSGLYKTLLIWPYAVAPAVAAALWLFIFHPSIGVVGRMLAASPLRWNYVFNPTHALVLIILASAWKQVSYNFIFFLAGLQSIPKSLTEAAAVDGAGSRRMFWSIVFPLLSPVTFFLMIVNLVYAFFDTFGVVDALTKGGPAKATETLVYKVYVDGVVNHNIGPSAAQSVILMLLVIGLTSLQFRYVERRVHYA